MLLINIKDIATPQQIKSVSNINLQKFESEIVKQQDKATLYAVKNTKIELIVEILVAMFIFNWSFPASESQHRKMNEIINKMYFCFLNNSIICL